MNCLRDHTTTILGAIGLLSLWAVGWWLGVPRWQEEGYPAWFRLISLGCLAAAVVYVVVAGPRHWLAHRRQQRLIREARERQSSP
jgi:hypothetical protein